MPETKTKVIVVGGGIAGPVLAILLKLKGYDPIVYERVDALADVGLSIWYAPLTIPASALLTPQRDPTVCSPTACACSG